MDATALAQPPPSESSERDFLARALLEVAERECRRIGQELHDQLCQVLLGAAFAAKAAAHDAPMASPLADQLEDLTRLINSAVQQARDIARGLNPVDLSATSLVAELEKLAAQPRAGILCRFEFSGDLSRLDASTALHLYRIAQEAIANAALHSGGTEVVVRLRGDEGSLHLEIRDDGRGWDRASIAHHGLGLPLMKYRAEAIQGQLRLHTSAGGGTLVACSLPMPK